MAVSKRMLTCGRMQVRRFGGSEEEEALLRIYDEEQRTPPTSDIDAIRAREEDPVVAQAINHQAALYLKAQRIIETRDWLLDERPVPLDMNIFGRVSTTMPDTGARRHVTGGVVAHNV